MRTVFGFQTKVKQRNALHASLGDDLVSLSQTWLGTLNGGEHEQVGALANGVFAWSGSVDAVDPESDGFDEALITLWVENGTASFGLQIRAVVSDTPFRTIPFKPTIIDELIEVGTVEESTAAASGLPRLVKIDRARAFTDELLSPERAFPVVVVTSNHAGKSAVRPTDLARVLSGLAVVAHVQSTPVIEQIEKALGSKLSVTECEARIYWPGLTKESPERLHRLFKSRPGNESIGIEEIYEAVVRVLASQFRTDHRVEGFIKSHPGTWPLAPVVSISSASDSSSVAQDQPGHNEADLSPDEEISHLKELIANREERIRAMETELFEANDRIRQSSLADRFSIDSVHQFALISDVLRVQNLGELIELFEAHVPDSAIVFLPEAHESARKSPYTGGLQGPARLLTAVCSVATRYHFGNLHEGEDFKRAFQAAGEASFASDSSASTFGKYRNKYTRTYDDGTGPRAILLRPHVSFGSGRAHSSVKIYWHVDERNRRFVIGQIGEHLPIASRL